MLQIYGIFLNNISVFKFLVKPLEVFQGTKMIHWIVVGKHWLDGRGRGDGVMGSRCYEATALVCHLKLSKCEVGIEKKVFWSFLKKINFNCSFLSVIMAMEISKCRYVAFSINISAGTGSIFTFCCSLCSKHSASTLNLHWWKKIAVKPPHPGYAWVLVNFVLIFSHNKMWWHI